MLKLSELDNLQQFLNNGVMYSHFMDFCNLVPGYFAIISPFSEMMLMNRAALTAANVSLDEIVEHDYLSYRSKVAELAPDFFNRDLACKNKGTDIATISWAQYGKENHWELSLSIRKPIYGAKNNIIGLISHVTSIDILLGSLHQFCILHQLDSFFSFKKQFAIEISDTYPNLNLSARQAETLFFLLYGKTSKEIATILHLSTRTIEYYIDQIKLKFNCLTKSQLIDKSIAAGYLGIFPKTLFEEIKNSHDTLSL